MMPRFSVSVTRKLNELLLPLLEMGDVREVGVKDVSDDREARVQCGGGRNRRGGQYTGDESLGWPRAVAVGPQMWADVRHKHRR